MATLKETLVDFGCAAGAGIIARIPCHPLDTIKTVGYAVDSTSGVRTAVSHIYRHDGLGGFFRGAGIACTGAAPGVALFLWTYERSKEFLGQYSWIPAPVVHLAGGFAAEAVSCVVWVPVDVVKERLQSQDASVTSRYRNSFDGFRTIAVNEGVRGLYKGYFSTLASYGPTAAIYFASFEVFKDLLGGDDSVQTSFISAALGNTVAGITTNPLELVKTRLQVQRAVLGQGSNAFISNQFKYGYSGLIVGLRGIIAEHGVAGLFAGSAARVIYTVPNAALTMSLYTHLKNIASGSSINARNS